MYVLYAALDLQSCGITTEGASHFQEVLRLNATLIVLDLRANVLLGMDSICVLATCTFDTIYRSLTKKGPVSNIRPLPIIASISYKGLKFTPKSAHPIDLVCRW